jgi:hypothetical protein
MTTRTTIPAPKGGLLADRLSCVWFNMAPPIAEDGRKVKLWLSLGGLPHVVDRLLRWVLPADQERVADPSPGIANNIKENRA